jgi:hypothetical protein
LEDQLLPGKACRRSDQRGTASGLVSFVGNGDAIDEVMRITLGNRAISMSLDRAAA